MDKFYQDNKEILDELWKKQKKIDASNKSMKEEYAKVEKKRFDNIMKKLDELEKRNHQKRMAIENSSRSLLRRRIIFISVLSMCTIGLLFIRS